MFEINLYTLLHKTLLRQMIVPCSIKLHMDDCSYNAHYRRRFSVLSLPPDERQGTLNSRMDWLIVVFCKPQPHSSFSIQNWGLFQPTCMRKTQFMEPQAPFWGKSHAAFSLLSCSVAPSQTYIVLPSILCRAAMVAERGYHYSTRHNRSLGNYIKCSTATYWRHTELPGTELRYVNYFLPPITSP